MFWHTFIYRLKYFILILVIGFCSIFESGCSTKRHVSKSRTHAVSYKKKKKAVKKKVRKKKKPARKKTTRKSSTRKKIIYPFK